MKSKKTLGILLALVAAVLVTALLVGLWLHYRPAAQPDADPTGKTFSVVVAHSDGSEKTFQYTSQEQYLGTVLVAEGLVQGDNAEYGLYIKVVDGEQAIYEEDTAYWSIFVGEESAMTGADQIVIQDGVTYKLVYTKA